ncbi:hypothetical protein [Cylindrospermum sp. FACHB-282]|uniref:hypothetical protein n=1 Tax=Cylindrospermum sp. FACHB-282 TaxID=2692794 RepID=UPI002815A725|nr:hypothetical protein [Cylindrospermum sp. FACHB-282]
MGSVYSSLPLSQPTPWGLITLFIAVFSANINMGVNQIKLDNIPNEPLFHAGRLPFPAVLIAGAWWYTKPGIIPKSLIPKDLSW